jgi:hypothetical protein
MKKLGLLLVLSTVSVYALAQTTSTISTDTLAAGKSTIVKDARLDVLAKKQAEFNKVTYTSSMGPRNSKGYRLMIINSKDREQVIGIRTKLMQNFSEHKVYMTYQAPFIKLKFGNFVEKGEADRYKRLIQAQRIVTGNVYVVQETIEVKPDKKEEEEDK